MTKKSKLLLTLRLLIALFVVFTIGNVVSLQYSKRKVLEEADLIATRDMDNLLQYTDGLLSNCEVAAYNLRGLLGYDVLYGDTLYKVLERFLNVNPQLYGVALGFEPEALANAPIEVPSIFFWGNKKEGFNKVRLDTIYDYLNANWCKETRLDWTRQTTNKNKAHWDRPMHASNGHLVAPFCVPLMTPDSVFMGTLAVDVALDSLSNRLLNAAPYPDAIVTMMDQKFNFVAHPNHEYVFNMTLDSLLKSSVVQPNESIYVDMKNKVRGKSDYGTGSNERLMYYAPVERAGWTLTIDCPYKDIYAHVDEVKWGMLFNMILGLLIFSFVCYKLFQRVDQYEKVAAQKASMQGELNIAASIQKGMLPKLYPPFPEVKEIDVFGTLIPAKEVGGDLFDYFIRDGKFFFCIGDVSGKGVPASLFMAVLRSLFRNITLHVDKPAVIADALNQALSEGNDQNMFCTMFLGVLDLKSGHLRYCNCGHNAPVVRHVEEDGSISVRYEDLKTNMAVGIIDGFRYEDQEVNMKPGEAIFLYTDGVTEAESATKELYGEQRLLDALAQARAHNASTAKDFIEAIYNDVELFAEKDYQSDDITMVVVEYKGMRNVECGMNNVLNLTNDINRVPELGEWVDKVAESAELPTDKTFQLNLALEEAVVNVMNYAYPDQTGMPITLTAEILAEKIKFTLEDEGVPFDPTKQEEPNTTLSVEERPIGGLGIMLVRQFMQEISYEYKDGKNVLHLAMLK